MGRGVGAWVGREEGLGVGDAPVKAATPLPESPLAPKGAFMRSFEQLAESLGGRPF